MGGLTWRRLYREMGQLRCHVIQLGWIPNLCLHGDGTNAWHLHLGTFAGTLARQALRSVDFGTWCGTLRIWLPVRAIA